MKHIKQMTRIITGVVLLLFATCSLAQTKSVTVSGRVLEETDVPAIQATIQLLTLPDSVQAAGVASSSQGFFALPAITPGRYVLKVSYIGFKTLYLPLQLSASLPKKSVGVLTLETDAVMLSEAVITAEAPQVQVVEDTLVYNASAYRTPEGAMLEELVGKLPGAEIDEDGNVKLNGKELKKIMVDGKEFFGGDVKTGLKNLPVDMIEKLKTYDKKSDMARITGIDDGEEEVVLDLTVKKGMKKGWFGNTNLAAGTEERYRANLLMNRFVDQKQLTVKGTQDNVDGQGISGRGANKRGNNGLTAHKSAGVTFATENRKMELGGNVRYNYTDKDVVSSGFTENFLANRNSYSNSNSKQRNKSRALNAEFRWEWRVDSLTTIILRPNLSYSSADNLSRSERGTFKSDPFALVADPNNWLALDKISSGNDPLEEIRINASNNGTMNDNSSISAGTVLQLNRKLNNKGRNIGFRGQFSYSNRDNHQYTQSKTHYFQLKDHLGEDSVLVRNRYVPAPVKNYNYSAQLTYSEPIAKATFLQFSYQFQYRYSESDRRTYDLQSFEEWQLSTSRPDGYEDCLVDSLGKYAEYRYYNHNISTSLRFIRKKYQLSAGVSLQPQHTVLSYKRGKYMIDTVRNVVNFTPNLNLRIRFSKATQLRMTYNGRSSQPGMENLLPIVDNSNPQNIRVGNPGLKPAFTHTMNFTFNTYNAKKQRSLVTHIAYAMTQNSVSNSREYNPETGGWKTTPKNINGDWNATGSLGFNTTLFSKKYTLNTTSNVRYRNNVGYLTTGRGTEAVEEKNTTTNLTLGERLNLAYRNSWLELGVNGNISYSIEKNKLRSQNDQKPYQFSYGSNLQIMMPWKMTFHTNIANQSRRGYTDSSMNRDELIWNAQLSQTFLKGAATVSFEMYDILREQSNISRSLTANGRSVNEYNGVNSYCMLCFIYRLNVFGGKSARGNMRNNRDRDNFDASRGGFGGGRRSF